MSTEAERVEGKTKAKRYKIQYPISDYRFPGEARIHDRSSDDLLKDDGRCGEGHQHGDDREPATQPGRPTRAESDQDKRAKRERWDEPGNLRQWLTL